MGLPTSSKRIEDDAHSLGKLQSDVNSRDFSRNVQFLLFSVFNLLSCDDMRVLDVSFSISKKGYGPSLRGTREKITHNARL